MRQTITPPSGQPGNGKTRYGLFNPATDKFLAMTDGRTFETSDQDKAEKTRKRVTDYGLTGIEIRPLPEEPHD